MTDAKPDTSEAAVGRTCARLSGVIERVASRDDVSVLRIPPDANHDVDLICDEARSLLRALLAERDALRAQLAEGEALLRRYRAETPLGHQPHMIAAQAAKWLATLREAGHE